MNRRTFLQITGAALAAPALAPLASAQDRGFQVELGEGDNAWPATMQALDEIKYAGWAILEVPGGDAARLKFLAERTDQLLAS